MLVRSQDAPMYKRPLLFISYTLFIIVAACFCTSAYFYHYVIPQSEEESLSFISPEKVAASPLKDDNVIVEIFSYGCHYCEMNEANISGLGKVLPAGARLIQLHINNEEQAGLAAFAPLFATLTVMGIEAQHRTAAYQAIIEENDNLADKNHLNRWLKANGIDQAEYDKAHDSEQVKALLAYLTSVSRYYRVNATPSFIVNRKWLAVQDREFPAFNKQLLSLLQHDKPLEP